MGPTNTNTNTILSDSATATDSSDDSPTEHNSSDEPHIKEEKEKEMMPHSAIIASALLTVHTAPIYQDPEYAFDVFDQSPTPSAAPFQFLMLEVQIANTPAISYPQVIDGAIDRSGSMGDSCKDGKTKADHAAHTFKNIVSSIAATLEANVTLALTSFDHFVDEVIPPMRIEPARVKTINAAIDDKLTPRGGTDLHKTLLATQTRSIIRQGEPGFLREFNLTLTDGRATQGILSYDVMCGLIPPTATNIFFAFGSDHDSKGLQKLANTQEGGKYYFVDAVECAYVAFGEVLHTILYGALDQVTISVQNGHIYDYRTNEYVTDLKVHSFSSELKKNFNIRSQTPRDVVVTIAGRSLIHGDLSPTILDDDITPLPELEPADGSLGTPTCLLKHMMRQKGMELMFRVNELVQSSHPDLTEVKGELRRFSRYVGRYMIAKGLNDDEFLQTICADIDTILATCDTGNATMYSGSRMRSQGDQTSYQVPPPPPERQNACGGMRRHHAQLGPYDANAIADVEAACPLRRHFTAANASPRMVGIMRAVSGGHAEHLDVDIHTPRELVMDEDQDQDENKDENQDENQDRASKEE